MITAFLVLTDRWHVCRPGISAWVFNGSAALAAFEGAAEIVGLVWGVLEIIS